MRMIALRIWLGNLLDPSFRFVSHIMFRMMGYSRLRVGTLTLWGPREFLEASTAAVSRLRELDSGLHDRLTTHQKLEFVYTAKHSQELSVVRIFTIDDSYMVWKSDGIIARLVYSAQMANLISRRVDSMAKSRALHSQVLATTRSWLEARRFPEPLIDCFREQAV